MAITLWACGNAKHVEEAVAETTEQKEEIKEEVKEEEGNILWVNSYLGTITTSGQNTSGLLTQQGVKHPGQNWECVHEKIEGFTFEHGYIYKLKVETVMQEGKPTLKLVEQVSKMVDMDYYRIHDIWALTHLRGKEMDISETRPNLEVNLAIMKIMGKGMCNNYFAKIEEYTPKSIQFGPIAGTKMMCPEIKTEQDFTTALSEVRSFEIKNLTLMLKDEEGAEILRFQKVD